MGDHCSARGQIGTGPARAALAGPVWILHSIVGWELAIKVQDIKKLIPKKPKILKRKIGLGLGLGLKLELGLRSGLILNF